MKLRFAPRAIANLVDVADYFHERNPAAGRRVRSDIYAALEDILLFPEAGRTQNVESVRKFVSRKYAYLVYYRIDKTRTRSSYSAFAIRRSDGNMRTFEELHRHCERSEAIQPKFWIALSLHFSR